MLLVAPVLLTLTLSLTALLALVTFHTGNHLLHSLGEILLPSLLLPLLALSTELLPVLLAVLPRSTVLFVVVPCCGVMVFSCHK